MKPVVIFGTGDFARVAHVYLDADSPHEVVAFTVNRDYATSDRFRGLPLVAFEELEERYPPEEVALLVAIGFSRLNRARTAVFDECKRRGYELITYVSSRAYTWGELEVGENCFVFEANVLQPFVRIGDNTILWSGNHVGHDVTIGRNCFIASHAVLSGNVTVEDDCFIGVNATFRDGVTVGRGSVIGAGAVVMKDVPPDTVLAVRSTEPFPKKASELDL